MTMSNREDQAGEVTQLLREWRQGDPAAFEQLMPLVYDQLHRIAMNLMRGERQDHTLQATALLHEVYFRLESQRSIELVDRGHFFAFAARLMRMILVDHARAHKAERRGGPNKVKMPLSEDLPWLNEIDADVLDLDRALDRLEALDSRKARLIELRFFLSLTVDEASEVLGVSRATVERDLRFVRGWLFRELRGGDVEPSATPG